MRQMMQSEPAYCCRGTALKRDYSLARRATTDLLCFLHSVRDGGDKDPSLARLDVALFFRIF